MKISDIQSIVEFHGLKDINEVSSYQFTDILNNQSESQKRMMLKSDKFNEFLEENLLKDPSLKDTEIGEYLNSDSFKHVLEKTTERYKEYAENKIRYNVDIMRQDGLETRESMSNEINEIINKEKPNEEVSQGIKPKFKLK